MKHKTVAHDLNVVAVSKRFLKLSEKSRTVLRKFLHPLCERNVEALPQIRNLGLRLLISFFGFTKRTIEHRDLFAQRCELLIKQFDLGKRLRRQSPLLVKLFRDGGNAAFSRNPFRSFGAEKARKALFLCVGRTQTGPQRRQVVLSCFLLRAFQREQFGHLSDLLLQTR